MHNKNLQLILLFLMLILAVLINIIILTRTPKLNSKAQIKLDQAFEIKDENGNIINCKDNACPTNSSRVTIQLINPQLLNR